MTSLNGLDKPAPFVEKMAPALERATALLGGTDAMRAAGTKFLPKFPGESDDVYKWRLLVATLNNFYEAMAKQMVGLVFGKAVEIEKSQIPEDQLKNLDKRGAGLHDIAVDLAFAMLTKGRPHILIDHPKKPDGAETLADDQAHGLRPYWVVMDPEPVFSAHADTDNGEERLSQVRWRECGADRSGYEIKPVQRIRVMDRVGNALTFEKFERYSDTDQWVRKDQGELKAAKDTLIDIPLVTFYANRQGFMISKPTLDDVAHKNIEHWMSSADQRHILTAARFPTLAQFGTKDPIALIGPYSMFHTDVSKNEADVKYVEITGASIEQGWTDLSRIVSEAEAMAVRIITSDAAKTEGGEQIDYAKEGSQLQKIAVELERGLQEALKHHARWLGLSDEQAGTVKVHKDFGISGDDAKAVDALIKMRAAGDISRKTLWTEIQERGLLKAPFVAEEEDARLADEQQQSLDRQMLLNPPNANDDENDEPEDDEAKAA